MVFCLLPLAPALSAQTANKLITDACYNTRRQLDDKSLWSSRIERRNGGHVYLETIDRPIHRLIAVDDHEPSRSERKDDDDRLHDLVLNPKARLTFKRDHEVDMIDDRSSRKRFDSE